MSKKTTTIIIIIILALTAGVFIYVKNTKTSPLYKGGDLPAGRQDVRKDRGGKVSQEDNVIPSEVEESHAESNVIPVETGIQEEADIEFGISDVDLEYDSKGSVNTEKWGSFEKWEKKHPLPLGWSEVGAGYFDSYISNVSNHEDLKDEIDHSSLLFGEVVIKVGGSPVDIWKDADDSESDLLLRIAEEEVNNPSFKCRYGNSVPDHKCRSQIDPKCFHENIKVKNERKYIITECYYDKNQTELHVDEYILNRVLIYKTKYGHMEIFSVSMRTKDGKESIDNHEKIFDVVFGNFVNWKLEEG